MPIEYNIVFECLEKLFCKHFFHLREKLVWGAASHPLRKRGKWLCCLLFILHVLSCFLTPSNKPVYICLNTNMYIQYYTLHKQDLKLFLQSQQHLISGIWISGIWFPAATALKIIKEKKTLFFC